MSYDIHFCIREKNTDELITIGESYNITWNVRELIKQSSGWNIKNEDTNGFAKDLIPMLERGKHELYMFPEKFKQYESPNGWGTIEGVKHLYRNLIKEWEELIDEYSRYKKLAPYIEIYVD
jgi:hypothetical protein